MKKLSFLILFLVLSFAACGQTTHYGLDATLEWNPVGQYEDMTPFLPTDIVEYEVYRSMDPVIDRAVPDLFLGTVSVTSQDVTFPNDDNKYAYAVRTKITTDEDNTVLFSGYNWSDVTESGETTEAFLCKRRMDKIPSLPLNLYMGVTP